MAEMEYSPICVSPIMPMGSDFGGNGDSGPSAVRLVSDWDGVQLGHEFELGSDLKSGKYKVFNLNSNVISVGYYCGPVYV